MDSSETSGLNYIFMQKEDHGFGMRKQNLPSDNWTERFTDWLTMNGWLGKKE
jgi:hypothetical protein